MRVKGSTSAAMLMTALKQDANVLVKVADLKLRRESEGRELYEYGNSLCGESTYLDSCMVARVERAFEGPVLPPMPAVSDYVFHETEPVYKPGWVYFVFNHSEFVEVNERVASRTWYNNEGPEYLRGTARDVGCYSGFDVIGFPPDFDMTRVFETINYAS
jgi:hypothetical protein